MKQQTKISNTENQFQECNVSKRLDIFSDHGYFTNNGRAWQKRDYNRFEPKSLPI